MNKCVSPVFISRIFLIELYKPVVAIKATHFYCHCCTVCASYCELCMCFSFPWFTAGWGHLLTTPPKGKSNENHRWKLKWNLSTCVLRFEGITEKDDIEKVGWTVISCLELSRKLKSRYGARNRFQAWVWNWVAKLHRLAGRYDHPMPTWFLAPIAGLKLPTLEVW